MFNRKKKKTKKTTKPSQNEKTYPKEKHFKWVWMFSDAEICGHAFIVFVATTVLFVDVLEGRW